jgi:hypothetical protein
VANAGQHRTGELAWLEPWQDDRGRLVVGSSAGRTSERSLEVGSAEELIAHLREVSERVHQGCGYWVAVSLGGLGEPALYAAAVGDRWHFWYLDEGGDVSRRSVGDEAAAGVIPVIFSEFDEVPESELVPGPAGEQVLRAYFESGRLSDAIRWRER